MELVENLVFEAFRGIFFKSRILGLEKSEKEGEINYGWTFQKSAVS